MDSLNPADVWRDVGSRISFHTSDTASEVPEQAGCYGWFLPLWLPSPESEGVEGEDLQAFMDSVTTYYRYDTKAHATAVYHWDSIGLTVNKNRTPEATSTMQRAWKSVEADGVVRETFKRLLMEASLFMPPLYVGRTDNLRTRYYQHVSGNTDRNNFKKRFEEHARAEGLPLRVIDLIFMTVRVTRKDHDVLRDRELTSLLESLILRTSGPVFSLK